MKKTILIAGKITFAFLTTVTVLYFINAKGLIWLFMKHEQIISYGTRFLRGLCLATPFLAIDFLAVGVFQACGMGKKSLMFAISRKIVLEIPALVIFNQIYPLYGLAYAQPAAEVVLAIAAVIVLAKIFKKLQKTD